MEPALLNLRRLVHLRWIATAGQIVAVWVAVSALHMALPVAPLAAVIAASAVLNLVTLGRLRLARPVTGAELFLQLLADVSLLSVLLYLSGGAGNPFVVLYLLPLTLTAIALPGILTWIMMGVTIAAYSILLVLYEPLPHIHGDFNLHVLGMWFGFVLSAALIAGFAVRMSNVLRERDRLAAEVREQELRHERVLALGTLAAGAAHELGTPLATMAMVAGEIEGAPGGADREHLRVLRQQVFRCREILSGLSASAGEMRAESGRATRLDAFLASTVARFREARPGVQPLCDFRGTEPAPLVVGDQALARAIGNLLNNAADANALSGGHPAAIEVEARWDMGTLTLEVRDGGPGLPEAVRSRLGEPGISTKPEGEGMGIGIFLSVATLRRLGGSLEFLAREGGGTRAVLNLPLARLLAE